MLVTARQTSNTKHDKPVLWFMTRLFTFYDATIKQQSILTLYKICYNSARDPQSFIIRPLHVLIFVNFYCPYSDCMTHPTNPAKLLFILLLLLFGATACCVPWPSLMISLHRSQSHALFHHAFTSKVLLCFHTETSHLNPVTSSL